jgi:hypothetical protein
MVADEIESSTQSLGTTSKKSWIPCAGLSGAVGHELGPFKQQPCRVDHQPAGVVTEAPLYGALVAVAFLAEEPAALCDLECAPFPTGFSAATLLTAAQALLCICQELRERDRQGSRDAQRVHEAEVPRTSLNVGDIAAVERDLVSECLLRQATLLAPGANGVSEGS